MKLSMTQDTRDKTQEAKGKRCVFNHWFSAFRADFIALSLLILTVLVSVGYGFTSRPVPTNRDLVSKSEPDETTPNSIDVSAVCELIYQGQFDTAGLLANSYLLRTQSAPDANAAMAEKLDDLTQIVREYQAINQRRTKTMETTYQEQITKLEKFQAAPDVNDVIDINDVNDLAKVFSVIARAGEFADQRQKKELLSDSFVEHVFQKAIDKASEFEMKGLWFEAYANCYYWLKAIDANNEAYANYAELLREKANIVASFQDSPCESSKERFEGVQGKIFVRAIDFLRSNYVNTIDYRQMATKAVKHCELLAEVMKLSFSEISKSKTLASLDKNSQEPFMPADSNELSAWSAGLTVILDKAKDSSTEINRDSFIDIFEKVLLLNAITVQLPRKLLIAQFAEAALSALDNYTVMVWPRQVQEFEKMMTNKFTGIGIRMTKEKGLIKVASLLPDTPASRSGLDAGDVIKAVDGVETKDMSTTCAVKVITGPAGTDVVLTIRRPGNDKTEDKVWDITITRDVITVPTVFGWQRTETGKWLYMIDSENRIAYVRISSFAGRTASDLEKVLLKLESEGLKGLILDLRFNSGGFLPSAIEITDKFIEKGLIVSTRPPRVEDWTWEAARKRKTHPRYPLVVLINSDSASASEIVAGALADPQHNRAILVGDRTHGKGSVQSITQQSGGAQLKYTMAYYHLPSGQRVESREAVKKQGKSDWGVRLDIENREVLKKQTKNDWGVGPDVEVKFTSDESRKMYNVQWDNLVLARADHNDNGAAPLKKHTIEETLESDPQLAVGLLVIKSQLIQADALATNVN
jgi:carboxyl-terminal processing protease